MTEIEEIVKEVFTLNGIPVDGSRKPNSVRYRMCIIYIARLNGYTYQFIGRYILLGHDTCIVNYNKCVDALNLTNTYPELRILLLKSLEKCQ